MKQLATFFLTVFYFITTVGVTVNIHYCQGEVSSVMVFSKTGKCCCSVETMPEGCCDDETFFYQLDDIQLISQNFENERITPKANSIDFTDTNDIAVVQKETPVEELNLPPPQQKALWLLNCSLTYYG
jgi:hypothetical protein